MHPLVGRAGRESGITRFAIPMMFSAFRLARRIVAQPVLAPYQPQEFKPGAHVTSDGVALLFFSFLFFFGVTKLLWSLLWVDLLAF